MANPSQYYCYLWIREKDGEYPAGTPYYVGKGKGYRAFEPHLKGALNRPSSLSNIFVFNCKSEDHAYKTEIELIHNWGRLDLQTGCLRNQTFGGDGGATRGNTGMKHSEESKEKMRKAAKKRITQAERIRLSEIGKKGAESRWGIL